MLRGPGVDVTEECPYDTELAGEFGPVVTRPRPRPQR